MNWLALGVLLVAALAGGCVVGSLLLFVRDVLGDAIRVVASWSSKGAFRLGLRDALRERCRVPGRDGWAWPAVGLCLALSIAGVAYSVTTTLQQEQPLRVTNLCHLNKRGFIEGLAPAQIGGRWGYVDADLEFRIPPVFSGVRYFSEGLAAVCVNHRWGYIDRNGSFVIEPRFLGANSFVDGHAMVALEDGSRHIIDREGTLLWTVEEAPAVFDDAAW